MALLRPATFESVTVLGTTASTQQDLRLAGLASQLGLGQITSGSGGVPASPDLILQMATSPVLLDRVLDDSAAADATGPRSPILRFVAGAAGQRESPADSATRRARAVRDLRDQIVISKNRLTNSAYLSVHARAPRLAYDILSSIVRQVNVSLLEIGRGQAAAEHRFVAARLAERERALDSADKRLGVFLARNKEFRLSPELNFEYQRLERDVTLAQQLVSDLAKSNEESAIREVRDTPVLVVLQPAIVAVEPMPRHTIFIVAAGVLLGAAAGLAAAIGIATEGQRGEHVPGPSPVEAAGGAV